MRDSETTLLPESRRVCSRSLARALSAERVRKRGEPQPDGSRAACLRPRAHQALLAFAAGVWCPEVGLPPLLSQVRTRSSAVLPAPLRCGLRLAAGWPCRAWGPRRPAGHLARAEARQGRVCHGTVPPGQGQGPGRDCRPSAGRGSCVLSHPRSGTGAHSRREAGSYQRERARAGSQGSRLGRRTHASVDPDRAVPARACSPSRGRRVGTGSAAGLRAIGAAHRLLRPQARPRRSAAARGYFWEHP